MVENEWSEKMLKFQKEIQAKQEKVEKVKRFQEKVKESYLPVIDPKK